MQSVKLDQIELPPEIVATLENYVASNCPKGTLWIGAIEAAPESAYLLWHSFGEAPVSMIVNRSHLRVADGLNETWECFLAKWRRRMH